MGLRNQVGNYNLGVKYKFFCFFEKIRGGVLGGEKGGGGYKIFY